MPVDHPDVATISRINRSRVSNGQELSPPAKAMRGRQCAGPCANEWPVRFAQA
jgi:hypothetical protein